MSTHSDSPAPGLREMDVDHVAPHLNLIPVLQNKCLECTGMHPSICRSRNIHTLWCTPQGSDEGALDFALNRVLDAWYNDRPWFHTLAKRCMLQVCYAHDVYVTYFGGTHGSVTTLVLRRLRTGIYVCVLLPSFIVLHEESVCSTGLELEQTCARLHRALLVCQ